MFQTQSWVLPHQPCKMDILATFADGATEALRSLKDLPGMSMMLRQGPSDFRSLRLPCNTEDDETTE